MSRNVYDDWNITGGTVERNLPGVVPFNSRTNSFFFIASFCLLLVFGLICQYSASYPEALANGLDSYAYFFRQLIYTCIGMVVAFVFVVLPEKVLKLFCPIFLFACLITMGINFVIKSDYLISENMLSLVFFSQIMYLSLFFANRTSGITRLRELILPIFFSMLFLVAIMIQKNFAYALLLLLITIVMFACGGVGTGGVILLVLYALVPAVCWILADETNLTILLNLFVPGYFNSSSASQYVFAKSAIAGGGLFGKGLGMGEFKNGLISGISGDFVFCNICEEFGFLGAFFLIFLFLVFAWSGYRCAKHIRNENRFYSNFSIGITTFIVWQFILNILSVFGVLPLRDISLPFFSDGMQIILIIVECSLVYKSTLIKTPYDEFHVSSAESKTLEKNYDIEGS